MKPHNPTKNAPSAASEPPSAKRKARQAAPRLPVQDGIFEVIKLDDYLPSDVAGEIEHRGFYYLDEN